MICPKCGSENYVRNGHMHNGRQRYMCKECAGQFVEDPENKIISPETKDIIDNLPLEEISLAGAARVTGVSEKWLREYVSGKFGEVPRKIRVAKKKKGRLTIGCDETGSYVGSRKNRIWIWLAKDIDGKEIAGCHMGSRDRIGAAGPWDPLPGVYRQCAVCQTDFWSAYESIFPCKRHRAVGKGSGKTNNIGSCDSAMRQRISRLVRKTPSFSKKIENHIGAIWYSVHYHNASLV